MRRPARQGEGALSDAIRAALAHEHCLLLYRNAQCAVLKSNRMVRGGLGNGSADLVGVLGVEFMRHGAVGVHPVTVGRFVALEVKRPGEIPTEADIERAWSKVPALARAKGARSLLDARVLRALPEAERHILEQSAWLRSVREVGGFAAYVDGVEGARAAIQRARGGATQ